MMSARLSLVLPDEDALPAEGRIVVFRPRAGTDLAPLPKERVRIVQGFRPDHDAFAAQGYTVSPVAEGDFVVGVVFLPRAKIEARALVAEVEARTRPGGQIWIDGQKTDGVDGMLREIRARVAVTPPQAKAHGKIFGFTRPEIPVFTDWAARPLCPAEGFVTVPGLFSADAVDRGSAMLASALPAKIGRRVADLGAGWGWLSAAILTRPDIVTLDLIEAEYAALDCARRNIGDARARFHWADATRFSPEARYDAIVTNPPFHTSRAADPGLGAAFIHAAAGMLGPSGQLWMVANRHLPYERVLSDRFREVEEVAGDAAFKVFRAARAVAGISPRRAK